LGLFIENYFETLNLTKILLEKTYKNFDKKNKKNLKEKIKEENKNLSLPLIKLSSSSLSLPNSYLNKKFFFYTYNSILSNKCKNIDKDIIKKNLDVERLYKKALEEKLSILMVNYKF